MRKFRIVSQVIFVILFVGLFYLVNNQVHGYAVESEALLKLNPFTAVLTTIASHSIVFSLALTAIIFGGATIIFGRFFCGFLCPLGSIIDFTDTMLFKKMRTKERIPPKYFQRTKYAFMIALLVLSLFGGIFTLYHDPLSFTTRILTITIDPIVKMVGNDANRIVDTFSPTTSALIYSKFPMTIRLFYGTAFTMLLALVIIGAGFWDRRFWCQYICPSGAFFGCLSRFSFFRRQVSEKGCNSCQRCAKTCPVHAIDEKDVKKVNLSECIECGVCVQLKDGCSAFRIGKPAPAITTGPDLKRRHLVAGAVGGLLLAPAYRANAVSKRDDTGRLIRPPGAIPEKNFLFKCVGCGECMKACPTNTLQPCMFSDGFNRLYTPKVVPRVAGCEEKCHLCGYVCPTGAIRKLPYEEKRFVKIGTAVIDRNRCVAWEQNKECLVCDEVCPYNAITAHVVETTTGKFKVPVLDEDLCIGCGMCEQHCPVSDAAAIVIYKFGENRLSVGPYTTDAQKKAILKKRSTSDSKQLGQSAAGEPSSGSNAGFSQGFSSDGVTDSTSGSGSSALPPGFSE
jgi:MauM/NapG family ferredoxin protein